MTGELWGLKAKLHHREGAVTWEIFLFPDKVGWSDLLGHSLRFSKNSTELMQEIHLRSRCKNIIESQDCITLKGLEFLDPEEDTIATLPRMDDS